jgi:signal transduction histidine kinase/ActR/RegA family two-component response regulator
LCRISEPDFPGNRIEQGPESRSPGMTATLPLQLRTKDQKSLWVQISAVPVQWVKAPALLCFIRDVTQQKLLENQLLQTQKIDAIGAMAGGIAHDFNNILSAIQGNTSLALMGMAPTHEYYKKFKDIETYAASGTELTRQLLDFAGSTTKHPEPLDLQALLRETAAMFSRTRKEIRLRDRYVDGRPIIEADGGQIRQAVMNLLINAWQAMPNGGEIEIETALTRPGDVTAVVLEPSSENYIRVTISDTGAGMTPELMSKIFDPFFTTKKKGKGTGLGLPSVYGIVQRHGGHIDVESRPGKGSRFHLYLPLSQKPAVAASQDEDAIQTGTETVLIIDDEPDILAIGREMLEVLGYVVHAAGSGEEALRLYAQHKERIDLVILDMIMPEMNGEMVYRRLSEINPLVRVLIASGYSPVGPARNLLTQKSCGFIQKPFKIQQLSQAIRKLLAPEAA